MLLRSKQACCRGADQATNRPDCGRSCSKNCISVPRRGRRLSSQQAGSCCQQAVHLPRDPHNPGALLKLQQASNHSAPGHRMQSSEIQ